MHKQKRTNKTDYDNVELHFLKCKRIKTSLTHIPQHQIVAKHTRLFRVIFASLFEASLPREVFKCRKCKLYRHSLPTLAMVVIIIVCSLACSFCWRLFRECYVFTIASTGFFSFSPAMLSAMYDVRDCRVLCPFFSLTGKRWDQNLVKA